MSITSTFSAEWSFKVICAGFRWTASIEDVSEPRHVLARRVFHKPRPEVSFDLTLAPGSYVVTVAGAYGNKVPALNDGLFFKQASHCGITSYEPLRQGALAGCVSDKPVDMDRFNVRSPPPSPPPAMIPSKAKSGEAVEVEDGKVSFVTVEERMRKRDFEKEDGELYRVNPQHDGAFISMKIGGFGAPGEKKKLNAAKVLKVAKALKDNYIIIQGRIFVLMVSVEVDFSIIPGKMEEGGGMYFHFVFEWSIGGVMLAELGGHLDIVPLDIEGMLGISFLKVLAGVSISIGMWIKPHILNYVLVVVDYVLKAALSVIMLPILLALFILQVIFEALIFVVEAALRVVQAARKGLDNGQRRVNARLNAVKQREATFQAMEARLNGELTELQDSSRCQSATNSYAMSNCDQSGRDAICSYQLIASAETPVDCSKIIDQAKSTYKQVKRSCCTLGKRILRVFIRIIIAIVQKIVNFILMFLKVILAVVEAVFRAAQVAIEAAKRALDKGVADFNSSMGVDGPVANGKVNIAAFYRWLWNPRLKFLRIYYMSVATTFSATAWGFECSVDMVFFGWDIKFTLSFYLNFKKLWEAFIQWIKDAFSKLFGGGRAKREMTAGGVSTRNESEAIESNLSPEDEKSVQNALNVNGRRRRLLSSGQEIDHDDDVDALSEHADVAARQTTHWRRGGAGSVDAHLGAVFLAAHDAHEGASHTHGGGGGMRRISVEGIPEEFWEGEGAVWVQAAHDGGDEYVEERHLGAAIRREQATHAAAVAAVAAHVASDPRRSGIAAWAAADDVGDDDSSLNGLWATSLGPVHASDSENHRDQDDIAVRALRSMTTSSASTSASRGDGGGGGGGGGDHHGQGKEGHGGERTVIALLGAREHDIHAAMIESGLSRICAPRVGEPIERALEAACTELVDGEDDGEGIHHDRRRENPNLSVAKKEWHAACRSAGMFSSTKKHEATSSSSTTSSSVWRKAMLGARKSRASLTVSGYATVGGAVGAHLGMSETRLKTLTSAPGDDAGVAKTAALARRAAMTSLSDPCEASAVLVALTCGAARRFERAAGRCAAALNSLTSRACSTAAVAADDGIARQGRLHRWETCAAQAASMLPCSSSCVGALRSLSSSCGGFIPRLEQGFHHGVDDTPQCDAALHAAQSACSGGDGDDGGGDTFCARLLEAAPDEAHHAAEALHRKGERFSTTPQTVWWNDQGARGVVPAHACKVSHRSHVDLRGNHLLGVVPGCVWAAPGGVETIYLSRNRLTGDVGMVAPHVRALHVNGNRLTGELGLALERAHGLRRLDVADNKLSGHVHDFLHGKTALTHLVLHGNAFTDSPKRPLSATLAGLPTLETYDVGRNAFAHPLVPVATAALLGGAGANHHHLRHRGVSLVLRLGAPLAHFCPLCDGHAHGFNCGVHEHCRRRPSVREYVDFPGVHEAAVAMGRHVPQIESWGNEVDTLDSLLCTVKAHVLGAVAAHDVDKGTLGEKRKTDNSGGGGVGGEHRDVDVRLLRTTEWERSTVVSIEVTVASSSLVPTVLAALQPGVLSSTTAAAAAGGTGRGARDLVHLAPAEGCDARAAFGRVEVVAAQALCPTGHMGASCQYVCPTRWERFTQELIPRSGSPSPPPPPKSHSAATAMGGGDIRRRLLGLAEDHLENARAKVSAAEAKAASAAARANKHAESRWGQSASTWHDAGELPPYKMHVWRGNRLGETRHPLSMSTSACSVGCRGHAHLAADACKHWHDHRSSSAPGLKDRCQSYMRDVVHYCDLGSFERACASGHASYTPARNHTEDTGCEVCGLYHHFKQYGAFAQDGEEEDDHNGYELMLEKHEAIARRDADDAAYELGEMEAIASSSEERQTTSSGAEGSGGFYYDLNGSKDVASRLTTELVEAKAITEDDIMRFHAQAAALHLGVHDEHLGSYDKNKNKNENKADASTATLGNNNADDADEKISASYRSERTVDSDRSERAVGMDSEEYEAPEMMHAQRHHAGTTHTADAIAAAHLPRCHVNHGCIGPCADAARDALSTCLRWVQDAPSDDSQLSKQCEAALTAGDELCSSEARYAEQRAECFEPVVGGFRRLLPQRRKTK